MTDNVLSLADRRKDVVYTVTITQGYDGHLEVKVVGVATDERSRKAVARALRDAADLHENQDVDPTAA